ncbi:ABC transporter permease [Natronoarchaeum mannanilyticum]|uniref:ABC-2 type transport system permease protein n=1 Tax=Natronoarchaeum mannanilyticum TaxID=926360 RepID=A0AAV3TC46_9EURY
MSLAAVAQKDFEDAARSKMLWSLTSLLVLLIGVFYVAAWYFADDPGATQLVQGLALPMQVIVPLAALIAGYMSIVGERRSGSIKVLLGLPPTRSDVVFGKLLGRSGVVATAVLTAFVVATVLSGLLIGGVPLVELGGLLLASILLGLAFVGIAVGVSAAVSSRGRAMAAVVGTYLLFLGFWDVLIGGLYRLVTGAFPPSPIVPQNPVEPWALLLQRLNPMEAYGIVASALIDTRVFPLTLQFPIGINPTANPNVATADLVAGEAPFYLNDWFAGVVLLAWFVVPVVLGYVRFRGVDLG